jgi:hypothetical protein
MNGTGELHMHLIYTIFEWLLVLSFVGLVGVIIWLVISAISLKNAAMRDAKRIYERPVNSVKSLIATGKGIALQESVRVKHMAGDVKVAAGSVRETAGEVKTAADAIQLSELKTVFANFQNVLKFASAIAKVTRSAEAKQGAA